jgi:hypothetical protein
MVSDDELKASILHKLAIKRKWGESHTAFESVAKGVPLHMKGKFQDLAHELIKAGLIVRKPTGYGLQISLNVKRSGEINAIIRKYLSEERQ